MRIEIKGTNVKLNKELKDFVERKINGLAKFLNILEKDSGQKKPLSEAKVEIGKTTRHHRRGPFYRAECQIDVPGGKKLRAESRSEDLRTAITEVKDELQEQLKKYKGKIISQHKRGKRKIKKSLHLSPLARFKRGKGGRTREESL